MTPTPRRPSRTQSTVLPFVRPVRPTGVPPLPPSAIAMLPLPENVTVVTDMVDLLWSVVATDRFGDRATLGMIHRRGPGFEATILADPIRTVVAPTLSEAAALVADAGPARDAGRRRA
jgi:hypothetical protein